MEKEKTKKIATLNTIKKRIKNALENTGSYNDGLAPLIDMTAGNLYAYYMAIRSIEGLNEVYIEEMTREGNIKKVEHPAFSTLRQQTEIVRKLLRELRLTIATSELFGEDDFNSLIDAVEGVQ